MVETLTYIAFYAGWPNTWAAFRMAKDVYADDTSTEEHGSFWEQEDFNADILSGFGYADAEYSNEPCSLHYTKIISLFLCR